jgi:hypothetical protein
MDDEALEKLGEAAGLEFIADKADMHRMIDDLSEDGFGILVTRHGRSANYRVFGPGVMLWDVLGAIEWARSRVSHNVNQMVDAQRDEE